MRFHVTGINRSKGSHMALDIDAPSKASAEKQALAAGMEVQHIQPIVEKNPGHERHSHRGENLEGPKTHWLIKLAVVVIILAVLTPIVLKLLK